jgi:hypothetical protein
MGARQFFPPIPSTFRFPKGGQMTDGNLLVAWRRFSTDRVRQLVADGEAAFHRLSSEDRRVLETRRRVLALREAQSPTLTEVTMEKKNMGHPGLEAAADAATAREPLPLTCPRNTFSGMSFRDEERAKRETADAAEREGHIRAWAAEIASDPDADPIPAEAIERAVEKHAANTRAYWAAMSRCMSPMITGPANFPVERNRKRNDTAMKRAEEMRVHYEGLRARFHRIAYPFGADGEPIRGNDPQAIAKLTAKLATARGAEKRRLKGRIDRLTAKQERGTTEREVGGIRVVENVEADRIQLIFPGKPSEDERSLLKGRGFRWSPRYGAWQRHLNWNGREAARAVLARLAAGQ